jgi:hypothetical protein
MHGLIGERLLKQFLGGSLHRTENDAMNETGLPENGGKTTDKPDGPKPEKAQGKQNVEPHEESGTMADRKADETGPQHQKGRREK